MVIWQQGRGDNFSHGYDNVARCLSGWCRCRPRNGILVYKEDIL
ncbi:MAG: hypothetical protein OEX80_08915 [Candidatus Aminicenantes bacterium]|nr:hypothetical protein [Candidatus Aminicenantes bacterium]